MSETVHRLLNELNIVDLDILNRELSNIKHSRVDDNSLLSDLDYDFLVRYFHMREEGLLDYRELDNYREQIERKAAKEGLLLGAFKEVKKAAWKALNTQQQIRLLYMKEPIRSQKMDILYLSYDVRTKSFNEIALGGTVNQLLRMDDSKCHSISIDDVTDSYDRFLNMFLNKYKPIDQMGEIERLFCFKWIVCYGRKYMSFQFLFPNASWLAFSEETFVRLYNWYESWRLKSKEEIEHEEREALHKLYDTKQHSIKCKRCPDEETAIMSALKHGYGDAFGF